MTNPDLEWFAQIVLRELCKLEKATRKELSDAVQAGLVEKTNTKRIVQLRMQLAMLGCIQQGLEEVEHMEGQQIESKSLRVNIKYMIEVGEKMVARTGCFEGLSEPYTSQECLTKYYAIGMKLRQQWIRAS